MKRAAVPEQAVVALLVGAAVGIVAILVTYGWRAGWRRLAYSTVIAVAGMGWLVRTAYLAHRAQLVRAVGAAQVRPVLYQAWGGLALIATFALFAVSTWWVRRRRGGYGGRAGGGGLLARRRARRASRGAGGYVPLVPPGGGWEA